MERCGSVLPHSCEGGASRVEAELEVAIEVSSLRLVHNKKIKYFYHFSYFSSSFIFHVFPFIIFLISSHSFFTHFFL